jgi:hypothetical protein
MTMNNDHPICEVDKDGSKHWHINGNLHRVDGPASEYANGDKAWYLNDELHRVGGPAVECANGIKHWYVDGERVEVSDNDTFLRMINLKAFW